MSIGSPTGTLRIIEGGSLVRGKHVAVPTTFGSAPGAALMTAGAGGGGSIQRAVHTHPRREIKESEIAISVELASELNLRPGGDANWTISASAFDQVPLSSLTLELGAEQPLETAVAALANSEEVAELLIEVTDSGSPVGRAVQLSQMVFRIRDVVPQRISGPAVLTVTQNTEINLYAPSTKSGVDIVILADCSGSMGFEDLKESGESAFSQGYTLVAARHISRSEALRRALKKLLDIRLTMAGRVSRIALVAFTEECYQRFPRVAGMEVVDESSPPPLIQEFRDAVALLQPQTGSTDIGKALQFGAQLLTTHGHPANDRLLVLISDGAHWVPEGEEGAGKEVAAVEEPISLMEHFHREMNISLHAIGISTSEIFNQWYNSQPQYRGHAPEPWAIPNHALLAELVRVGGGDPSRTGDANVLEKYFAGLGSGLTRRVTITRKTVNREPAPNEFARVESGDPSTARVDVIYGQIRLLANELLHLRQRCNTFSERETRKSLLETSSRSRSAEKHIGKPSECQDDFDMFIIRLHQLIWEPAKATKVKDDTITKWFSDPRWSELNALRVWSAHDTSLDERSSNHGKAMGAMVRHTGVAHMADDDFLAWGKLQAGVLGDCCEILRGIESTYLAPDRRSTASGALVAVPDVLYRD